MVRHNRHRFRGVALLLAALALWGCESQPPAMGPGPQEPPEVAVVVIAPEPVLLTTDLPGRASAYLVADLRPQVSGIIQSRHFEEGQDVNAGDLLYQIDPPRYQAVYDQAEAALAVARANVPALRARVERLTKALKSSAVSEQDYDEAVAALAQGEATVALRAAQLESARIDLSYTRIVAPISGRIGKSDVTVGALVTANQPVALATIRQFDPIYVDVQQSSTELLRLKRHWEEGRLVADEKALRTVRLVLGDGTPYPHEGQLEFRDITVDPTTGAYTLRLVFPNPDKLLMPGMFAWATVLEGTAERAIMVPQQGISRNTKGQPVALVVDQENVVQQVVVTLARAIGNRWLVSDGLSEGDRLIVEGLQRVRPGSAVRVALFDDQPGDGKSETSSQPSPSAD